MLRESWSRGGGRVGVKYHVYFKGSLGSVVLGPGHGGPAGLSLCCRREGNPCFAEGHEGPRDPSFPSPC